MRVRVDPKNMKPAKLSLTSMIDVVFLLIIFFMVVTELTKMEAEAISLPVATKGIEEDPRPGRVVVNIRRNGVMVVQRREYSARQLRSLLHELSVRRRDVAGLSELPVKIRADAHVEYKYVQRVMVQCMRERVWKLSFGCVPNKEPARISSGA